MDINSYFFFLNVPATTKIYTLSLHDALPISAAIGSSTAQHVTGTGEPQVIRPAFEGGGAGRVVLQTERLPDPARSRREGFEVLDHQVVGAVRAEGPGALGPGGLRLRGAHRRQDGQDGDERRETPHPHPQCNTHLIMHEKTSRDCTISITQERSGSPQAA